MALPLFRDEAALRKWNPDRAFYLQSLAAAAKAAAKSAGGSDAQQKVQEEIRSLISGSGRLLRSIYEKAGERPSNLEMFLEAAPVFISDDAATRREYSRRSRENGYEWIATTIALNRLERDFRATSSKLYDLVATSATESMFRPFSKERTTFGGLEAQVFAARISTFPSSSFDFVIHTFTGPTTLTGPWIAVCFADLEGGTTRALHRIDRWEPGQKLFAKYPRGWSGCQPRLTVRLPPKELFVAAVTANAAHAMVFPYAGEEMNKQMRLALQGLRVEAAVGVKLANGGKYEPGLKLHFAGFEDIDLVVIEAETRFEGKTKTFRWSILEPVGASNQILHTNFFAADDWKFPRSTGAMTLPDEVLLRVLPAGSDVYAEFGPWKPATSLESLGVPRIKDRDA